jgi:hypothetical protein
LRFVVEDIEAKRKGSYSAREKVLLLVMLRWIV